MEMENHEILKVIKSTLIENPSGLTTESLVSNLNSNDINIDSQDLMEYLNTLAEQQSIVFMTLPGGKLVFKARSKEEAELFKNLSDDERVIFSFIKESGNSGSWIKHIKEKSGLHTKVVTDIISKLEKRRLIKKINSVKQPTKKVYMLFELEPSVELTGGSWYTDNNMDVEFIEQLATQIQKYIFARSRPQNKVTNTISLYPLSHYCPTSIPEIHDWITNAKLTSQPLSQSDVEALVNRLVYDGLVYKFDGEEYYVSSKPSLSGYNQSGSGLIEKSRAYSDSPCGSCPVFDFCKKGGPIEPANCEYLEEWLNR